MPVTPKHKFNFNLYLFFVIFNFNLINVSNEQNLDFIVDTMAKKQLVKSDMPGPRMEIGKIKLNVSDHFFKYIMNTLKFGPIMEAIKEKLMKRQLHIFKMDVFAHLMKMNNHVFSEASTTRRMQ